MRIFDKLLFDKGDYELLEFLVRLIEQRKSQKSLKRLFDPYLHPHGIKELAASCEIRIAYAMIKLLGSLEEGKVQDRLNAMRSLHSEIMSADKSAFRINTARVLLQIMKEVVRCHGDKKRQLELIHDFRTALTGKLGIIRAELKKYHLLEMSGNWNQIAFDDHIHDANTKGRKTPSHLIMDAWIKGIRSLKIIYYNHIRPEAARELLEAAEIMGVKVRISVEFPAKLDNRYVQLIWAPRGFSNSEDFLNFFNRDSVKKFMNAGIELSEYQSSYIIAVLDNFNKKYLNVINRKYSTSIDPVTREELNLFAGAGQISLLHVAELIHSKLSNTLINSDLSSPNDIYDTYLTGEAHPEVNYPGNFKGGTELPKLLKLTPAKLLEHFSTISTSYRLTLNLSTLRVENVLDLLFATCGKITHLEIFNLKDFSVSPDSDHSEIDELRNIINEQNVIKLKRLILQIIEQIKKNYNEKDKLRIKQLKSYLDRLPELLSYYRQSPLRIQIGSDSTGRSWHLFGMGFAALDSLPLQTQRNIKHGIGGERLLIPFSISVFPRKNYIPRTGNSLWLDAFFQKIRQMPFINILGYSSEKEWIEEDNPSGRGRLSPIVSLGGSGETSVSPKEQQNSGTSQFITNCMHSWKYLNTNIKNALKIFIGFIPAFLTFALTKNDWWVLQYCGAFIWFGITGFRNIIQSVLGGRGVRKSGILPWNNFVSWGRVADSLLFTGFSVPLLDFIIKTQLLSKTLGITTSTNPVMLYTIMAIANGIYISTHNIFRSLPKGAVVGNFFRSIISIPVAIMFNILIGGTLRAYGVVGIDAILQRWAAVISKTASDCVAGIIEGTADRFNNIRTRMLDYRIKTKHIFATYARLELLFPREDITKMLNAPESFTQAVSKQSVELKDIMIVNSLDMLYFYMYQPRAREAFNTIFHSMTTEEREIFLLSQNVLKCEKEISTLFVNGLVGKRFAVPLAFYLERSEKYLRIISEMEKKAVKL